MIFFNQWVETDKLLQKTNSKKQIEISPQIAQQNMQPL